MVEMSISREKAEAILAFVGLATEYGPGADYYLAIPKGGKEQLRQWGIDEPLAVNYGRLSWDSPGYPPRA